MGQQAGVLRRIAVAIKGFVALLGVLSVGFLLYGCGTHEEEADSNSVLLDGTEDPALVIDKTRFRPLESWIPEMQAFSHTHYGEHTAELRPTAIVLHFTAGTSFPWNLVEETEFKGERPGRASHYVVDGPSVWEILPPTVRSRCTHGANHRAISIEIVAKDEKDLFEKRQTSLRQTAKLVVHLIREFGVPLSEIRSHEEIDKFNGSVPWVRDLVNPKGSGKEDPGELNMEFVKNAVALELAMQPPPPFVKRGEIQCPTGFKLESVGHTQGKICVAPESLSVLGPFTRTMIRRCEAWKGTGNPFCFSQTWEKDFALSLRGAQVCPQGSTFDKETTYCVEVTRVGTKFLTEAFGPFPKRYVDKCLAFGGGIITCRSARWERGFLLKIQKNLNPRLAENNLK